MNTSAKKYELIFWLVLSALLFSCTPESCMEGTETQSYVKGLFYLNDGTGSAKAPDTLTVYGMGREDILLYDKTIKTSSVLLPLDASTDSCKFVFIINSVADTVTLHYTSYPHFISKECGYTYFHSLKQMPIPTYTSHKIMGITIKNNSVIIPNEENIRIFYN
jgi:hypothetical protein